MKILFATDGSPGSLAALATLVDMLGSFRGPPSIVLLHVHPALPYRGAAAWAGKETIARYYDEEGDAALADSRQLLDARGIAFTAVKAVGDVAPEIAARAAALAADVIAMGTQGRSALSNLVLGSVTTRVLALSAVPVLVLK